MSDDPVRSSVHRTVYLGQASNPVGVTIMELIESAPWMRGANCVGADPEAFFPEKGGSTRAAKRICGRCDVREACLAWGLAHDERYGIIGGHSERERRKIKRGEHVPFKNPAETHGVFCRGCGKEFADGKAKYCSDYCRNQARLESRKRDAA